MFGNNLLSILALSGAVFAADLPALQIKGSKFFYPNGTQFFMKGVAYQQGIGAAGAGSTTNSTYADPLADGDRCKQDIPKLVKLGTNIIRTYAIDPKADHTTCMQLLNDNGIYVVSDLSEPAVSINRDSPAWDVQLYTRYTAVIDSLSKHSNVVGFFVGNEVSDKVNTTNASGYVKAAVRDMKKYVKDKSYKKYVGYAADDNQYVRTPLSAYFNCGPAEESIDFFGYNVYSWCGNSDFEASGYNRIMDTFSTYSVPVFFAEYGCNVNGGAAGRKFLETAALYAKNMSAVVSGGIVYEYFQEENDFGLVEVKSKGGAPSEMTDFAALQKQIAAADPVGVSMSDYNPSNKALSCPKVDASWASSDTLPPTPNDNACACMAAASSCVPATSLKVSAYGAIFGFICGKDASLCSGINGNTTTGKYGDWSMCAPRDKLAIVLDAYAKKNSNTQGACSFDGQAVTQKGASSSDCSKKQPSTGGNGGTGGTDKNSSGKGVAIGSLAVAIAVALAI